MTGRNGFLSIMSILQCVLVTGLSINPANAESIDFVAGLSAGYTLVKFPAKLDSEAVYPSYLLSGSASYGQFYVSYGYADSIEDASISEEEDVGKANRNDQDLSLGYRLNKSISLFIGHKNSETNVDFRRRDSDLVRDEYYRQNGVFAGLSYGFTFKNRSNLNLSMAYVDLATKNRFMSDVESEDDDEGGDEDEFDDITGKVTGSANGFSASISWIMPLSDSLAFKTAYKINDYQETIKFEGKRYPSDTKVTMFTIGLLKVF
ncbi:MAG: hypothetical protein ACI9Y1_002590 [Lentisphaeria bacterium]|jgi:hypothetical protein